MSMSSNRESLMRDTDLLYLSQACENEAGTNHHAKNGPITKSLPCLINACAITADLMAQLDDKQVDQTELRELLTSPGLQRLLECHDLAAHPKKPRRKSSPSKRPSSASNFDDEEFIKTAGIIKKPGIPLGLSVIDRGHDIIIHRILVGSYIEKLGLLKRGDVIREVNSKRFDKAEQLQNYIGDIEGSIVFKLAVKIDQPEPVVAISPFMKAYFTYRPDRDNFLPDKNLGLPFSAGDVLQIHDKSDKLFWQAENVATHEKGLIPSEWLEDRRRTRKIRKESKKTQLNNEVKTKLFSASHSQDFDRCDCQIYESVARMPPFKRKMLVLIGAIGVGRDSLLKRLIKTDAERFQRPRVDTSRPKADDETGDKYNFVSREHIQQGIKQKQYLEHGEYNANLYGVRFKSITDVIATNRIVVLDVNPWTLRYLKTPQFMPYIVHIRSPSFEMLKERQRVQLEQGLIDEGDARSDGDFRRTVVESERLEKEYAHYFDSRIVNADFGETFSTLVSEIDSLEENQQWVPTSWVF